jgi:hypothetical protein
VGVGGVGGGVKLVSCTVFHSKKQVSFILVSQFLINFF